MRMAQLTRQTAFFGLVGVVMMTGSVAALARDNRVRLECAAEGAGDLSLDARYEERSRRRTTRKKFSVEFEAAPGGSFGPGQLMTVSVRGRDVGSVVLDTVVGGDIVGDLNFDTTAGPADRDLPFSSSFPVAKSGSSVVVKVDGGRVLGCRLR
jgi:hypothetical protein